MDQLTFKDVEIGEKQARAKVLATEIERKLKTVARATDRHTLAAINDKSYSYMSDILNTNNEDGSKPFQIKFIPSVIIEAPDTFMQEVGFFLCELCGYQNPDKKKDLTPEQELTALKRKISEHGLEKIFE